MKKILINIYGVGKAVVVIAAVGSIVGTGAVAYTLANVMDFVGNTCQYALERINKSL